MEQEVCRKGNTWPINAEILLSSIKANNPEQQTR